MSDVYKGIALPWGDDPKSFLDPKDDIDILKTSVMWILLTRVGERVMLPTFGSNLLEMVFEPNDKTLAGSIKREISEALRKWDDRIKLVSVGVETDETNENHVMIKIVFSNTKDPLESSNITVDLDLYPDKII